MRITLQHCVYHTRRKDTSSALGGLFRVSSEVAREDSGEKKKRMHLLERLIRPPMRRRPQSRRPIDRSTDRAVSLKLAMTSLAVGRSIVRSFGRPRIDAEGGNNRRLHSKEIWRIQSDRYRLNRLPSPFSAPPQGGRLLFQHRVFHLYPVAFRSFPSRRPPD